MFTAGSWTSSQIDLVDSFRLQSIYSRLATCKDDGAKHVAENLNPMDSNPIAVELGLDDPNGPGAVLRQATEALGEQRPDSMPNLVYMYFIDACEKLFDGELEVVLFEEHMRWFFGNHVGGSRTSVQTRAEIGHTGVSALHVGQAHCRIYQAGQGYSIHAPEMMLSEVQVQSVLSDNKSQELWGMLQDARKAERLTNQDMIRYRREAERHAGSDEHLYRIEWVAGCLSIVIFVAHWKWHRTRNRRRC